MLGSMENRILQFRFPLALSGNLNSLLVRMPGLAFMQHPQHVLYPFKCLQGCFWCILNINGTILLSPLALGGERRPEVAQGGHLLAS